MMFIFLKASLSDPALKLPTQDYTRTGNIDSASSAALEMVFSSTIVSCQDIIQ